MFQRKIHYILLYAKRENFRSRYMNSVASNLVRRCLLCVSCNTMYFKLRCCTLKVYIITYMYIFFLHPLCRGWRRRLRRRVGDADSPSRPSHRYSSWHRLRRRGHRRRARDSLCWVRILAARRMTAIVFLSRLPSKL
jgi:hypothetical protein